MGVKVGGGGFLETQKKTLGVKNASILPMKRRSSS